MKFYLNQFPEDPSFTPEDGWTPMKEPTNLWTLQLLAIPFMILNSIMILILFATTGIKFDLSGFHLLIGFVIIIPIHELLHALVFPERLSSPHVSFGCFPKKMMFFAYYTKEFSRNRSLAVFLAPFVVITAAGFLLMLLGGNQLWLTHIVLANALGACADTLGVVMVLTQIPSRAVLRNKGIRTYWRYP